MDRLQHHDRIIHQHAYSQRQASKGDDIQCDVGGVHQEERDDHRNGDGCAYNQRAPEIFQKIEQDQYGQTAPDHGGPFDLVDRVLDKLCLVGDYQVIHVSGL